MHFDKGFVEALEELRPVGLNQEELGATLRMRMTMGCYGYVAIIDGQVVGTASLLIERKFINHGGIVGHLEDVAVRKAFQKQGIGRALVKHCLKTAILKGCYKVILDCSEENKPFYEGFGFHPHAVNMRWDAPPPNVLDEMGSHHLPDYLL